MLDYRLSPGVAFCRFDNGAIVLDVAADRYWQTSSRLAATLGWLTGTVAMAAAPADLERLAALGLVTAGDDRSGTPRPATVLPAVRASLAEAVSEVRGMPRFGVQLAYYALAAHLAVRYRRLGALIANVESRRHRRRTSAIDITTVAAAYRHYRRLLPLEAKCLPDSLAFLALVARYGHYPRLVFGVTTGPFAAHCWVQNDDVVLNDAIDHVTLFRPILVV